MGLINKKLNTIRQLPYQEWGWFFCLYIISGLARLAIALLPFEWLSKLYGQPLNNTRAYSPASNKQKQFAWRIGRMARSTAKYTPWQSKCLVQALSARALLNYYQIPHVLYFGARRTGDPQTPMEAHAWLCVGSWPITGRKGHRQHGIVATYISGFPPPTTKTEAP